MSSIHSTRTRSIW